jgi:hypothetical protein
MMKDANNQMRMNCQEMGTQDQEKRRLPSANTSYSPSTFLRVWSGCEFMTPNV